MDTSSQNSTDTLRRNLPEAAADSWMDGFTAGRVAMAIVLFLFVLYPGVVLGTHSFFMRDYGLFTYPTAQYAHDSFWRGEVPLWNPLNNDGVPFLAQWNTSVCYPLSLIYLLFPLPWSLNFFCLAHLVLAGVGMYWLAHRWTGNRLSASLAAVAFALSGLMLSCLMWTSNLAALSWQPFVFLGAERAWRCGGRHMVIAALAGAMQMLAGAPEIVVFTWVMLGLLWLIQLRERNTPFNTTLRRLIVIVLLVAGLSAVQLLPFFDLLKHSQRDSTYVVSDASPMPVWGWANFIVPYFHDWRTVFGTYLQPRQVWTSSYYVGIGTVVLAFVAIWRLRRQPVVLMLSAATLAGLILALGNDGYVYTWVKHIAPWIGFARYPIKFVSIPVFTIPLLAAYGFNCFMSAENSGRKQRALLWTTAVFLALIVILLALAKWLIDPKSLYWNLNWWHDGILRALFLIAIVGMVTAFLRLPSSRLRGFVGLGIFALVAFDVVTAGLYVHPVVVKKAFGPLELDMSARPKFGESRAMIGKQVSSYFSAATITNELYYFIGLRGTLFQNCNIPENIPKVDGFCSLHLQEEWDVGGIFYGNPDSTNAPPAPLLDFLGVSQITSPDSIFVWNGRKSFLPLITAGQRPIFAGENETLDKIAGADFDPRHTVYLPLSARGKIAVTNAAMAELTSEHFAAQRVDFTVMADTPALAVIAQSFYHNWQPFVDGWPVPLLRANDAFQAVEIPAGQHVVVLRYIDRSFRAGAIISSLTLIGCLIFLLAAKKESNFFERSSISGEIAS